MCTHTRLPFLTLAPPPHHPERPAPPRHCAAPPRPHSRPPSHGSRGEPSSPLLHPHRAPSELNFTPRQLPGPPISTRSLLVPRNTAAAVVNTAGRPPTAELPAPPRPDSNQPPLQLTRGPVHLPGRSSPSLPHRSAAARCSRRRPCSGHPRRPQHPPTGRAR